MSADLILSGEVEARAALALRTLALRLLAPPYPALGLGRLRVLRLHERGATTEILCSYEGYARI